MSRALYSILSAAALMFATAGCSLVSDPEFDNGTLITLGGDAYFGEAYARGKPDDPPGNLDYDRGLVNLAPLVNRAQFALVNFEAPLSPRAPGNPLAKGYVHFSRPAQAATALAAVGVDAIGFANNHSLDQGVEGLRQSLAEADAAGLRHFGAGETLGDASAPLLLRIDLPGGMKRTVAVFGMFEYREQYANDFAWYATNEHAGVNPIDPARFAMQVADLKARDPQAYVIAYAHWGFNYSWVNRAQVELGHQLIDAGADIVIGHHAHTVQEIERYRGRWILYGIGNFDFNAPGRYAGHPAILPYGLVAMLSFSADPSAMPRVRLYPFKADNRLNDYVPQQANAAETAEVLAAILDRSRSRRIDARLVGEATDPAIQLGI